MSQLRTFRSIFLAILVGWLFALISSIRLIFSYASETKSKSEEHKWEVYCRRYPSDLWVRPDVYIYSQFWLKSLGISFVWNNPDIELRNSRTGIIESSSDLKPATEYDIEIFIHNRSTIAPGISVGVKCEYRNWGIGGSWNLIRSVVKDIPVLGGSPGITTSNGTPAEAKVVIPWQTPSDPGHYCILVTLNVTNDITVADNKGQENLRIKQNNPKPGEEISIDIPIENHFEKKDNFSIIVDSYNLPSTPVKIDDKSAKILRRDENSSNFLKSSIILPEFDIDKYNYTREKMLEKVIEINKLGNFPPPEQWGVNLSENRITLDQNEIKHIELNLKVPEDAQSGDEQIFNVWAQNDEDQLLGGVTILVRVDV